MNTDEPKKNRKKFTWFRFFPSEWVDVLTMTDCQAGKRFKQMLKRLITNSSQENTIEAVMINESIEYSEIKRKAAIRRWNENKKGNKATTPQPSAISTDGPRLAENGDASHREAEDESANVSKNMRRAPQNEAPAHGFSGGCTAQGTMSRSPEAAAQSGKDSALDMPRTDKASDPRGYNTGNVTPSHGPEDGKFHDQETIEISTNCGADAVNGNATVDRKSATSAPLRPWKEVVEKSLGISANQSGTDKGVRTPNPVPGLLRKRRAAGSPLKPKDPYPAARSLPKSMAEVSDFACSENLDYDDCRLWWEQNFVERKGRDKDGRKITNWRGALIRFCESAKRKRESA